MNIRRFALYFNSMRLMTALPEASDLAKRDGTSVLPTGAHIRRPCAGILIDLMGCTGNAGLTQELEDRLENSTGPVPAKALHDSRCPDATHSSFTPRTSGDDSPAEGGMRRQRQTGP